MKMVGHIDRLTFGLSLNESENPVNNVFFSLPSLIYRPRGAFLFLASRRRQRGWATEKKRKTLPDTWVGTVPWSVGFHLSIWKRTAIWLDGSHFIFETWLIHPDDLLRWDACLPTRPWGGTSELWNTTEVELEGTVARNCKTQTQ